MSNNSSSTQPIMGVYRTLDALFSAKIDEPEEILFGVHRGEVAGLFAVTNYGKTTLLMNATLSIAASQPFEPLMPIVSKPLRILYVDSESPAAVAKSDLKTMIECNITDSKLARANFSIIVDGFLGGKPINLSNATHFNWVITLAKAYQADLVVIDTASSAFEVFDENSNGEITRKVMNPLKRLAREANCAVIYTHHIGKGNENQSGQSAYKGRGASAFGALSRTIFTIEKDMAKGPGFVVLSCAKIKGKPFKPALLKLDPNRRWFDISSEPPSAKPSAPTAQEIADFIAKQTKVRTAEICEQFKQRAAKRTIEERIADAERLGLIAKANQKAPWHSCNSQSNPSVNQNDATAEPTGETFPQSANLIGECGNAETISEPLPDPLVEALIDDLNESDGFRVSL